MKAKSIGQDSHNIRQSNIGQQVNIGHISIGQRMALVNYSINHLQNKDKIRFYYALKGRDGRSGMVKLMKAIYLNRSVIMVRAKFSKEIKEFLGFWRCNYKILYIYVKK